MQAQKPQPRKPQPPRQIERQTFPSTFKTFVGAGRLADWKRYHEQRASGR